MDSRILDASAFYAGIPFGSPDRNYTTSLVYDEIKHIKKSHDAIGILIETKRLIIKDPHDKNTKRVISTSKDSGRFSDLIKKLIFSSIALSLELKGEIITDDFAVSNVSKNLGLKVVPILTLGISKVGKWIYYCKGCRRSFSETVECPLCGNLLERKLKRKSSTIPINK